MWRRGGARLPETGVAAEEEAEGDEPSDCRERSAGLTGPTSTFLSPGVVVVYDVFMQSQIGGQHQSALVMRWFPIISCAVLLVFPASAWAGPETAAEIEQCVRDNLPKRNSVQTVVFRSTNRVGDVTESDATIHWKLFDGGLSKVLLRFRRPLSTRGAGVLLIENRERRPDTFMYLPELRTVRRVSSRAASSSLFGTDFSYEDFERLVGMSADAPKERAADTKVAGRGVYALILRPDPGSGSAYERIVMFVDKETCVPLRTESYERGDELRKVLTADASKIEREGTLWVPRQQTMTDLRDETQTELLIEQIKIDAKIHDKMFSARELEAGAD